MKKSFIAFVLLVLTGAASAEESVKIGVITDLTGQGAYWGNQTRLGAMIAEKELNENGYPTKIILEDHALKAKNAITAAQKLIFADGADVIYSEFTVTNIGVSPVVKNAGKLFFSVSGGNSFLKINPHSVKSYIDYTHGCKLTAEHWKSQGVKNAAILRAESEYGDLCYDGFKQVYPEAQIAEYRYGEEVKTQALSLKNKNAEAVINVALEGDTLNMMKAFSEISFFPLIGVNFDSITEAIVEKYSDQDDKFISFGFKGVSKEFIERIKKEDPDNTLASVEAAALAYIHIKQIVKAVRACKRKDLECQLSKILEAKENTPNIINFKGFKDRQAVFEVGLKKWD